MTGETYKMESADLILLAVLLCIKKIYIQRLYFVTLLPQPILVPVQ